MIKSEIKTFSYPDGNIQRVQVVRPENWESLEFLHLRYSEDSLDCFEKIYRQFLVPACPWLFGQMVMFHLPEDLEVNCGFSTRKYGNVNDRLTAAAAALEAGVTLVGGKPVFRDSWVKEFWTTLEKRNCLRVVSGKLPVTTIIPVSRTTGYMTGEAADAPMKVNASFFIMDRFDCATIYDHIGTPLGLCVKDGVVENPPLYHREALLVRKDGSITVEPVSLEQMTLTIRGQQLIHGKDAELFTRPSRARTPVRKGTILVIIGNRVAAVKQGGSVPIPTSGFVLCPKSACDAMPGDPVTYGGMEDICFGIQVGNSILRGGVKTDRFISKFYNLRGLERVPYPPSLYPLDFRGARAARIALGADREGNPMVLWAEGAAKLGHVPGKGSCGASLSEMADICSQVGMVHAINLDGGGSAQILLNNRRTLQISDRNAGDFSEAERPVPLGLVVR